MKKSLICILVTIIVAVALVPTVAFADMGPKPSVKVFVETEQPFYITLLSEKDYFGPHQVWDGDEENIPYNKGSTEYNVFKKFANYVDKDGFVFLQDFEYYPNHHLYAWGYYPPDPFKVLVYLPNSDTFAVSEVCQSYAFNSRFSANINEDGTITVKKDYSAFTDVLGFFVRFLFTLAIEIGLAFAFGYKDKNQFTLIAVINMLTQLALNIALTIVIYKSGSLAFFFAYVIAEIIIFAMEAVLYAILLNKIGPKHKIIKHVLYAILANGLSLAFGLVLSFVLSLIPTLPI